jgi:hypothetical protein
MSDPKGVYPTIADINKMLVTSIQLVATKFGLAVEFLKDSPNWMAEVNYVRGCIILLVPNAEPQMGWIAGNCTITLAEPNPGAPVQSFDTQCSTFFPSETNDVGRRMEAFRRQLFADSSS